MSDSVQAGSKPDLYDELEKGYRKAKDYRERYVEAPWKDAIQLALPMYGEFGPDTPWPDLRFDSIGTDCIENLADGMFGNLTPSSRMWFRYLYADKQLNESASGGKHLEALTEHMVQVFNRSTYYDVGPEFLQIGIGLGTASMDVHEDKVEGRIICQPEHPRGVYVESDGKRQVKTVYVLKYYTADQAVDQYGKSGLGETVLKAYDDGDRTEFPFVEVVTRNPDVKPNSPLAVDWPWREYAFQPGDSKKRLCSIDGAHTFSKPTWRWKITGSNPYGWAPLRTAMPDIRTCNQMVRTWLLNLQRGADPATFDPEEGRAWSRDPGSRNYYRDPNRRGYRDDPPSITPHMDVALEALQKRVRTALKTEAFLMLMQIEAQMTAREVVERKREGMTVVSATVGKFETETLDRIHARFLAIEQQAGRLPEPPEGLEGQNLKVEYLGPISQMQREIFVEQGIVNALETLATVFTIWPESKHKIKSSLLVERIWQANAAPEDAMRNEDEYAQTLAELAKAAEQVKRDAAAGAMAQNIDPMVRPEAGSPAEMLSAGTARRMGG